MKTRVYTVIGNIDFNNSSWQWMGDNVMISDSKNQIELLLCLTIRVFMVFQQSEIKNTTKITTQPEQHHKSADGRHI